MKLDYLEIEKYIDGSKVIEKRAELIILKDGVGIISKKDNNTYSASVVEDDQYFLVETNINNINESRCDCNLNSKYGKCQHVLAFLFDLEKYLKKVISDKKEASDIVESNFINYFNFENNKKDIINLRPKILFNVNANMCTISFVIKMNNDREFKVTNIIEVLETLHTNGSIQIVKKLDLEKGKYKLNTRTRQILNIIKINSMYNSLRKTSKVVEHLDLSTLEALDIIKLFVGDKLDINFKELEVISLPIQEELFIDKNDDEIIISLSTKREYHEICKNRLYSVENKVLIIDESLLELFAITKPLLFQLEKSLAIPFKYFQLFMINSVDQLSKLYNIKSNEEFDFDIVTKELTTEIYVSKYDNVKLKIDIHFNYEGNIFAWDGYSINKNIEIIKKDKARESEILELINFNILDNVVTTNDTLGYLLTQNHNQSFNFIKNILPLLADKADLYIDDQVNLKLSNFKNEITFNIKESKIDKYFDYDYDVQDFDMSKISKIVEAYNNKESFFVMDDETYIPLEKNHKLEQLKFIDLLNTEYKSKKELIPIYKLIALKDISQTLFDNFNVDEKVTSLIEELKKDTDKEYKLENVKIRDYQNKGIAWLNSLFKFNLGGILADEMGLGKTLQVISFLNEHQDKKVLIVVPKALMFNWANEIDKFAPDLDYKIIDGTKNERVKTIKNTESKILITSYNMLRLDINQYLEIDFDLCIIDEAQNIKTPTAQITKAIKQIRATNKFALTGTPIENNLIDIWSIVDFINPGYLDTQKVFREKYIDNDTNLEGFKFNLSAILLRREKEDVLEELPEKIEAPIFCELTHEQQEVYIQYVEQYKQRVENMLLEDNKINSIEVLSLLTRLRQIACHPSLFIDNYKGDSGKLDLLEELIEENIDANNKMLIFSQFTSFLQIVKDKLDKQNIEYFYLDGKTSAQDRVDLAEKFNSSNIPIFLISLKAGGVGLNLTGATTVIHLDPWWNPQIESQATDRAHRIGQKNVVQVNKLITKDTIEEKIYDLQKQKKKITDDVLNLDASMLSELNTDQIMELFRIR
ncbi:MAG: SNF2-related protein [Mycoplasmatales bacterium]